MVVGINTLLVSPYGVAIDATQLYIADHLANTINVFALSAAGNVPPNTLISGNGALGGNQTGLNQPSGIAVDASHIYVANAGANSLTVYPLTASGNFPPSATISGSDTGLNSPVGVAVDGSHIYVANGGGNSVTVYPLTANGNVLPSATLSGGSTGIDSPTAIAIDAVHLYLANFGSGGSVTVYPLTASGNAAPSATLSGGATALNGPKGVAVDASHLYVSNNGGDALNVYALTASGNVAPIGTLSGGNTGISHPNGVAVFYPSVSAVSPAAGSTAGGTRVTISGSHLAGTSTVTFGATAATSFSVDSQTTISAVAPAGAAGTVDITVTTAGGTSGVGAGDQFTYVTPPVVSGVSPASGPAAGGTTVTITGSNLAAATAVKFGLAAARSFAVIDATSISAVAPAGTGTVDITVTVGAATSTPGANDRFTYLVPAPVVTGIAPASGLTTGGTAVTITGTNLAGATGVAFGSTAASSFTVLSATSISATAPAGSAGTVDIAVTTAGGTSATGASDQFTYVVPAPVISAITPSSGPAAGGTVVTITGTNLTGATAVKFGGAAASFTVVSATSISATAPAGSAGAVDIAVTTPGGTSAAGAGDQFTYLAPALPLVVTVNGPATIRRADTLLLAAAATLGGVPTSANLTWAWSLPAGITALGASATTPNLRIGSNQMAPGQAYTYTVTVSDNNSRTAHASTNVTILPSPLIVQLVGGAAVTATYGAGPYPLTVVFLDAFTQTTPVGGTLSLTAVDSDGHAIGTFSGTTLILPANYVGQVTVAATGTAGALSSAASQVIQFIARDGPTVVVSQAPSSGLLPLAGVFRAFGTTTGGSPPYSFLWSGPPGFLDDVATTNAFIAVPAKAGAIPGTNTVTLTVTDSQSHSASGSVAFTYIAPPTVTVSPASGPSGTTFTFTAQSDYGPLFYQPYWVDSLGRKLYQTAFPTSQNTLTTGLGSVPAAHEDTTLFVTVYDSLGNHGEASFTELAPRVTSISPASGPPGTVVTIQGSNFAAGAGVRILPVEGARAFSVSSVSAHAITCTVGDVSAGNVSVTVVNPDLLQSAAALPFTVTGDGGSHLDTIPPPTFHGLPTVAMVVGLEQRSGRFTGAVFAPAASPPAGGTAVLIQGLNLADTTSVLIGEALASFRIAFLSWIMALRSGGEDSVVLIVTAPPGTAGLADVIVTTSAGPARAAGGFLYSATSFGSGVGTFTVVGPSAMSRPAGDRPAAAPAPTPSLAVSLNASGTGGTLVGYVASLNAGFVADFALDGSGNFRVSTPALVADSASPRTLTLTGHLTGTTLSGAIEGQDLTFSLTLDAAVGASSGLAGFYRSASPGAGTYVVVGTQGEVFALTTSGSMVSAGSGTVAGDNHFTIEAAGSGPALIDGSIGAGSAAIVGTVTNAAGGAAFAAAPVTPVANSRLVNLSGRAVVKPGSPLTAGFVVAGTTPKTLLLRAVGPGLSTFGVPSVLAQPTLTVQNSSGQVLATNTGWGGLSSLAGVFASVGAFALSPTSLDSAMSFNAPPGVYTLQVADHASDAGGVVLAEIYDQSVDPTGRSQSLVNLSCLGQAGAGSNVINLGFFIAGADPKQVLIRGVGPGLAAFGVASPLPSPSLTVYDRSGTALAGNTGWTTPAQVNPNYGPASSAQIAQAAAQTGAFTLSPTSPDSAVLVTLAPGAYTAQVVGSGGATGTALIEVYELTP